MTYDGCRVQCGQCVHFKREVAAGVSYGTCAMVTSAVKVSAANNVCRRFEARIKNPSSPQYVEIAEARAGVERSYIA